jgi:hypothetical protein
MDIQARPDHLLPEAAEAALGDVINSIAGLARRLKPADRHRIANHSPDLYLHWPKTQEPDAAWDALATLGPAWIKPTLITLLESGLLEVADRTVEDLARRQLEADVVISGSRLDGAATEMVFRLLCRTAEIVVKRSKVLVLDADAVARRREWFISNKLLSIGLGAEALAQATAPVVGERPQRPALSVATEQLRGQVRHRHRKIQPPDLDRRPEVPIDELYTPQTLSPSDEFPTGYIKRTTTTHFVAQFSRAVVLGKPGGGKSTLAQYTCFELASQQWSPTWRRPIPMFVQLREWNPADRSVVEQLYATANTFYQAPMPEGYLEALLGAGLVLPVFDGLDEVLDLHGRHQAVQAIDTFGRIYPSVPILVSARRIGYEQSMLPAEDFDAIELAEFGESQVADYCGRWFRFGAKLPPDKALAATKAFLSESQSVDDIRRNPLLLSLMCILYRGRRYIPQNRPQLYADCARLLFEDWDRHRKIDVNLAFSSVVSDCVQYLAYWIFGDEQRERGVPEQQLVNKAHSYFAERLYTDPAKAREAAEELVAFCRGRAWILSATGTAADAPNIFQFTHRTFLEHFTGTYLARTAESPAALAAVLAGHIGDPQWEVVSQVAIFRQKEDRLGAADVIIGALLDEAGQAWPQRRATVAFLARCLAIVVPKPAVVARLVWQCLDLDDHVLTERDEDPIASLISPALDDALRENATGIEDTLGRWLEARLTETDGIARATSLITTIAASVSQRHRGSGIWTAAVNRWRPLLEAEARRQAANLEDAIDLVRSGLLPASMLFVVHGIDALFAVYRNSRGMWQPALGPRIAHELLFGTPEEQDRMIFADLADEIMSTGPQPRPLTISLPAMENAAAPTIIVPALAGIEAEPWVAGLVLFCCIWEEATATVGVPGPRDALRVLSLADLDGLKDVLERRSDEEWSTDGIRTLPLPSHVKDVVIAWAKHRINLLSEVRVIDTALVNTDVTSESNLVSDGPNASSLAIPAVPSRSFWRFLHARFRRRTPPTA